MKLTGQFARLRKSSVFFIATDLHCYFHLAGLIMLNTSLRKQRLRFI